MYVCFLFEPRPKSLCETNADEQATGPQPTSPDQKCPGLPPNHFVRYCAYYAPVVPDYISNVSRGRAIKLTRKLGKITNIQRIRLAIFDYFVGRVSFAQSAKGVMTIFVLL